jgi:hypothetical protein
VQKEAWLIHQIIELPLKRRNIVLGVFEISLKCLQLMLLLLVGIVGYPGELRQLALKLPFPGPAVALRALKATKTVIPGGAEVKTTMCAGSASSLSSFDEHGSGAGCTKGNRRVLF